MLIVSLKSGSEVAGRRHSFAVEVFNLKQVSQVFLDLKGSHEIRGSAPILPSIEVSTFLEAQMFATLGWPFGTTHTGFDCLGFSAVRRTAYGREMRLKDQLAYYLALEPDN